MTVTKKIYVFYDIMLCGLVQRYWHFRGTCCPHLICRKQRQMVPPKPHSVYQIQWYHIPEDSNSMHTSCVLHSE